MVTIVTNPYVIEIAWVASCTALLKQKWEWQLYLKISKIHQNVRFNNRYCKWNKSEFQTISLQFYDYIKYDNMLYWFWFLSVFYTKLSISTILETALFLRAVPSPWIFLYLERLYKQIRNKRAVLSHVMQVAI